MPRSTKPSYEEAVREVEQIVTEIERGEMDIDQLTPKIKRAKNFSPSVNLNSRKLPTT